MGGTLAEARARTSNPLSYTPSQVAKLAVTLVLAHVRIAPLTICVAVKRPTGGRPLSPGGPCRPDA